MSSITSITHPPYASTSSSAMIAPAPVRSTSPGKSRFSYNSPDFSLLSVEKLHSKKTSLEKSLQDKISMWNLHLRPANRKDLAYPDFISSLSSELNGCRLEVDTLCLEFIKRSSSPAQITKIKKLMDDLQSQMNACLSIATRSNLVVGEVKGMPIPATSVSISSRAIDSVPSAASLVEKEIVLATTDLYAVLTKSQHLLLTTTHPNQKFSTQIKQAMEDFAIMVANKKQDLTLNFGREITSHSPGILALDDLLHQTQQQFASWKVAENYALEQEPGNILEGEKPQIAPPQHKENLSPSVPLSEDEPGAPSSEEPDAAVA